MDITGIPEMALVGVLSCDCCGYRELAVWPHGGVLTNFQCSSCHKRCEQMAGPAFLFPIESVDGVPDLALRDALTVMNRRIIAAAEES